MRTLIEKDELIRLYFDEKKSYSEIGKIYSCSNSLIYLRFKEYKLKARSYSNALKGRENTWGNKISLSLIGKKRPGVGGRKKGSIPWNKNKTKIEFPDLFKNCSRKNTDKHTLALCNGQRKIYNKTEQLVGNSYVYLKYVGDKNFWVKFKDDSLKNPDFIFPSLDGSYFSIAIEVFGNYWHRNDNPNDLIQKYNNVGWRCIVLWEKEVKQLYEDNLLFDKIDRFINYDVYEPCVHPYDNDYGICLNLLSEDIKRGLI
jgi:hypothetical protein